jgi:sodium/proline symporter
MGEKMYEIIPGFAANCLTIFLLNLFIGQNNKRVLQEFDEVIDSIKGRVR